MNEKTPDTIKAELMSAISAAIANPHKEFGEQECNFVRRRKLTPEVIFKLLLSMQGGSLNKELYDAGIGVTASAFVQQRKKLSYTVLEEAMERFNDASMDSRTYRGYRVLAVDGTTVNMARNPRSNSFVCSDYNPKGYNQLHVNPMYDVLNKTYQHCVIQPQPQQDEIGALTFMLAWHGFREKTLIVAERGYESYNVFAHLSEKPNVDFLIRVKQDNSAMRDIKKLPMKELDTDISCTITTTQTNEDKKKGHILIQTHKNKDRAYSDKTRAGRWDFQSPYAMKFRVVRFKLDTGVYETLATSLPRSFTLSEIKELYHARWGIETAFRELKYGLGLVNLHGKKDSFVKQEIFASMIMSNFCSRISGMVAVQQKEENIHEYRVNFKMAVYLCRQFFRTEDADAEKLLQDIATYTEPVRPGRQDGRNIKPKSFVGFVYRVPA